MHGVSKQPSVWFVVGAVVTAMALSLSGGVADAAPPFLTSEDDVDASTLEGAPRADFVEESELGGLVNAATVDAETLGGIGPDGFVKVADSSSSDVVAAGRVVDGGIVTAASTPGLTIDTVSSTEILELDFAGVGVRATECYAVSVTPLEAAVDRIDVSFTGSAIRVLGYDFTSRRVIVDVAEGAGLDLNGEPFLETNPTFTGDDVDSFQTEIDFAFVVARIPGIDLVACEDFYAGS